MLAPALALLLGLPAHANITESKALPGVLIDDRGRPAEGAMLEAGLERLRKSPTLRALEPRRRERGTFVVGFTKLDTSTAAFSGAHGNTHIKETPIRVDLNEALFVSTHAFIETLAHELYGHGIHSVEAEALGLDVGHTIYNEANALAVGAVAALEVGASVNEEARLDALMRGTTAYEAEVLFEDAKEKRVEFSLKEAKNPREAIAARLKELARRRRSVEMRRQESLIWKWRVEHFTKVHRMDPKAFAEIRASVDPTLDAVLPEQKALLDAAEPYLREVAAWLETEDAREFTAGMVALSTSAYARELERELKGYAARIARLRAAVPASAATAEAAPADAVEQVDWAGLDTLCREDRAEHPEHWKGVREPGAPAPPWLAP